MRVSVNETIDHRARLTAHILRCQRCKELFPVDGQFLRHDAQDIEMPCGIRFRNLFLYKKHRQPVKGFVISDYDLFSPLFEKRHFRHDDVQFPSGEDRYRR